MRPFLSLVVLLAAPSCVYYLPGVDAGPLFDAGVIGEVDAGDVDAGSDAGVLDAGTDAGEGDAGNDADAGVEETDAGPTDAGPTVDTSDCATVAAAPSFQLCTAARTHADAAIACAALGGTLAIVEQSDANTALAAAVASASIPEAWLGLSDAIVESEYRWPDGALATFLPWRSGEPNNVNDEDCGEIGGDAQWNDNICTRSAAAFCSVP